MMVIAVHDIHKFLRPFAIGYPVKSEPVRYVFKKCPEEHAAQKQRRYFPATEMQCFISVNRQTNNKRKIHSPDD